MFPPWPKAASGSNITKRTARRSIRSGFRSNSLSLRTKASAPRKSALWEIENENGWQRSCQPFLNSVLGFLEVSGARLRGLHHRHGIHHRLRETRRLHEIRHG